MHACPEHLCELVRVGELRTKATRRDALGYRRQQHAIRVTLRLAIRDPERARRQHRLWRHEHEAVMTRVLEGVVYVCQPDAPQSLHRVFYAPDLLECLAEAAKVDETELLLSLI